MESFSDSQKVAEGLREESDDVCNKLPERSPAMLMDGRDERALRTEALMSATEVVHEGGRLQAAADRRATGPGGKTAADAEAWCGSKQDENEAPIDAARRGGVTGKPDGRAGGSWCGVR